MARPRQALQRRHPVRHLLWRGGVAAVSQAMMMSGVYPLLPHLIRIAENKDVGERPVRATLVEWGTAAALSAVRAAGFFPLPGSSSRGPRPIIVLHGYAMNRANFMPLGYRLARAGLGPVLGFEYWTLGRTAAAARKLGWFVDQVRAATRHREVDIIGHSMGGVVARYYVTFAGGDGVVRNLVTIGSPHHGTDVSRLGFGAAQRELFLGSSLTTRLAAAPVPQRTNVTALWSRADALVPGARQKPLPGAEVLMYDDLGHVSMLFSRRVARDVIDRLRR